jgi:hypothetical protein
LIAAELVLKELFKKIVASMEGNDVFFIFFVGGGITENIAISHILYDLLIFRIIELCNVEVLN